MSLGDRWVPLVLPRRTRGYMPQADASVARTGSLVLPREVITYGHSPHRSPRAILGVLPKACGELLRPREKFWPNTYPLERPHTNLVLPGGCSMKNWDAGYTPPLKGGT